MKEPIVIHTDEDYERAQRRIDSPQFPPQLFIQTRDMMRRLVFQPRARNGHGISARVTSRRMLTATPIGIAPFRMSRTRSDSPSTKGIT